MKDEWVAVFIILIAGSATLLGGLSILVVDKFRPLPYCLAMAGAGGVIGWLSLAELLPHSVSACTHGLEHGGVHHATGYGMMVAMAMVMFGYIVALACSMALDASIVRKNAKKKVYFDRAGNRVSVGTEETSDAKSNEIDEDIESGSPRKSTKIVSELDKLILTETFPSSKEAAAAATEFDGKFITWLVRLCSNRINTIGDLQLMRLSEDKFQYDHSEFLRVSFFTAFALGLHNIPEGMITFTSYMDDPTMGIGTAVAIAVHNIPEGMAVAMPTYFGTGSVWKALCLCWLSALGELIGAFIQWGIFVGTAGRNEELISGMTVAAVTGFMIHVAFSELLVSSTRYDPLNLVTMKAFVCGCLVMMICLIGLAFAGHEH